ncbi:MAG: cyclic nucleotide-binding domain-containing protein [Alphaproteobacteria bacterium]|nr:cyclic nucleotide-binding domain-containing protein [Alphaproteobacteria bacterium]
MGHLHVPLLNKITLFEGLPAATLARIAEAAGVQRFSNHGFLFREGEEPDFVYSFLEGGIVLVSGAEGHEAVIEFYGPGESVLLPAAILGMPYLLSARASSDGQALLVPASKLRALMNEDAALAARCARVLSQNWRALITQIKEIKTHGATARLAHFLISQADRSKGPATLVLPGMKKEVAQRLGIKPETFSRTLKKLRAFGVECDGDAIRIASMERLTALVDTLPA